MLHLKYKVMFKKILTVVLGLGLIATTQAQDAPKIPEIVPSNTYNTAIGIRGGVTSGLTIKHFTSNTAAVEGILGLWNNGLSATVTFQRYVPAFEVDGLSWYYGMGGHIAIETGTVITGSRGERVLGYERNALGLGVDGILGIEYKIPPIPFAVSIDMKPFAEVNTNGGIGVSLDPGLGIKFAF